MARVLWRDVEDQACVQAAFELHGITGWDRWSFSQFNLVTGENGAGKSRLLRAIRDVCQAAGIPYIYMDFTQVGRPCAPDGTESADLADPLLYHGSLPPKAYENFIPFLEKNIVEFSDYLSGLVPERERRTVISRRTAINRFLKDQLGRELVFSSKGCRITSREEHRPPLSFAEAVAEMSPGEKAILYFALGVLCVKADEQMNQEFVLLLDEPENHLHTKALIRLIKAVKELGEKSVHAVVASHSIFLVPLFRFEEILFISKSGISSATSAIYADAYNALIGDQDEESGSLREMLSSLSQWNFSNYLTECLCAPPVADQARSTDPQFQKLLEELRPFSQREKLRLLDYGGGSGRIAKCMELHFQAKPDDSLIRRLTYDVYDPDPNRKEMPDAAWMGRTYGKAEKSHLQPGSYDLVVLYNVLHEVDVTEWADTLNDILALLKDDGLLIFGERRTLSQGERPYGKSGYLVLDRNELIRLFGDGHVGEPIKLPEGGKDPTLCCAVSDPRSAKVTSGGVRDAIEKLGRRSKQMIESYIAQGTQGNKSREYAFYCQQYINAEHALGLLRKFEAAKPGDLKAWSCADIVNHFGGAQLILRMKERAKIQDAEGIKCAEWLKRNPGPVF